MTVCSSSCLFLNNYFNVKAVLVDEFANGLTNVLPSTIAFELTSSTSCEVIRIFVARDDEFVGVGAVSAIVVDVIDV
nr:hypothetical protein [Tanacetum cinerariifolium]